MRKFVTRADMSAEQIGLKISDAEIAILQTIFSADGFRDRLHLSHIHDQLRTAHAPIQIHAVEH